MKNLNTNESTSFESSLGSPSKPLQSYDIQKAKQIFLVNSIEEPKISITNTIIILIKEKRKIKIALDLFQKRVIIIN